MDECERCKSDLEMFGVAYFQRGPKGEHQHFDATKMVMYARSKMVPLSTVGLEYRDI